MRLSIANLDREPSMMERIFNMMEAHCPRLMKCGGGHLSRESPAMQRTADGCRVRHSTPEQDAEIERLGREGKLNATEIAHKVGVTASVVRRRLGAAGICVPNGLLHVTHEQSEQILKLAREGKMSPAQIGEAVGINADLIRSRLARAGIRVPDGRVMR